MKTICAFAPATIGNVNVGFDVLGLTLSTIGDKVELSTNNTGENKITEIKNGPDLPFEADKNCCTVVVRNMQERLGRYLGVNVKINKGFASGSGLGSSSASSAAAAFAFNELLDKPYKKEELVAFAAEGERIASGSAHFDNVAPAILGGMVLVHDKDFVRLPLPENLYVVSLFLNIKINTSDARSILKNSVPLNILSKQVANMGAFVASLYQKDIVMFSRSLNDFAIEPIRKLLIPGFDEMKQQALQNNALTFGISGSGPSVFAIAQNKEDALNINSCLQKICHDNGIQTQSYVELLNNHKGACITNYCD